MRQKSISNKKTSLVIIVFLFLLLIGSFLYISKLKENNKLLLDKNTILESELSNKGLFRNASKPITLNVEYGFHQGTHPKVLYFKDGFNGYKFYIAYTPYYKAQDETENPTIAVSNDGLIFNEIEGLNNPIDKPDNFKKGVNYNSDTHLVYNSDTKELECYWRYVEGSKIIIYRKVTKDGVHFGDKEIVMEGQLGKNDFLSPAIIYDNGIYKMWFIDHNRKVKYTESSDLKTWSEFKDVNVNYNDEQLNNWHFDVIKDSDDYKMVMSAYYNGHNHIRMNLYYSSSKDGINFDDMKVILTPKYATDAWDNEGIYRSSITIVDDMYYLYYSAISSNEDRNIGLIKVKSFDELFFN